LLCHLFFVLQPCLPTLPESGVQAHSFFAISLRSVNSIACGSKVDEFYFIDDDVKNLMPAAAAGSL
jgi:hypothetical protein